MFRDQSNQELAVEIMVPTGDDARERGVVVAADYWQRLGVRGIPRTLTQEQGRDRAFVANRGAYYASGITVGGVSDLSGVRSLHSREIPTAETRYVGGNSTGYQNAELDSLIDRSFVTIPVPERIELLKQISRHATEQAVYLSLFHTASPVLINNRLQNVTPRTLRSEIWNVHLWDVK